jgi:hypothetical protein
MTDLEMRVEQLERRANRYRNALMLLVVGLCAVVVVGATTEDGIITGKYLVLTNSEGQEVVRLGADSGGDGLARVNSKAGTALIVAGASSRGHGMLGVLSKIGTAVVKLGADAENNGVLAVASWTGTDLILAGASEEAHGLIKVRSSNGTTLIRAGATSEGNGLLGVRSKTGALRTTIGSGENGFLMEGFNKTGEAVVQLHADDYGLGYIGIWDRKGNGRTLTPR